VSGPVGCKAKPLHRAMKDCVEIVVGDSEHRSSLEASRWNYLATPQA
jgi:hypothetical protein